jgi:hypothetical protein
VNYTNLASLASFISPPKKEGTLPHLTPFARRAILALCLELTPYAPQSKLAISTPLHKLAMFIPFDMLAFLSPRNKGGMGDR